MHKISTILMEKTNQMRDLKTQELMDVGTLLVLFKILID